MLKAVVAVLALSLAACGSTSAPTGPAAPGVVLPAPGEPAPFDPNACARGYNPEAGACNVEPVN